MGTAAGLPFPDIYDMTWGEVAGHIKAVDAQQRATMKTLAAMLFKEAAIISKMFSGRRGETMNALDEFSFLWTEEELQEHRRNQIKSDLMSATTSVQEKQDKRKGFATLAEQTAYLEALEKKMGLIRGG